MRQPSREHSLGDGAELVHGTCVALGRGAALIRGPSGSGKSDLALRFLFLARRGPAAHEPPVLIADDQVRLLREGSRILATAPATIAGKMEVRGVGIIEVKSQAEAELKLVVELVWPDEVERLPDLDKSVQLLGLAIPSMHLRPWEAAAPIKLVLALARAKQL
jgi:HPr kinase/phosphorylase